MASKRVSLVWFNNTDLRLHDHAPLLAAHQQSDFVIHLYVIDDFWFHTKTRALNINKTGPFRCKFLKESVLDLRRNLNKLNSQLIIRKGISSQIIPQIVKEYNISAIYLHDEIHSEEQKIVNDVISNCQRISSTKFISFYGGNTMYHLNDLPWKSIQRIPQFKQLLKSGLHKRCDIQQPLPTLSRNECKPHPKFPIIGRLSSLKQFGCRMDTIQIDKRTQFPFIGGETAALDRLHKYVWSDYANKEYGAIRHYRQTRFESIGTEYSSKLSPYLAHGNISARRVYHCMAQFEKEKRLLNRPGTVYGQMIWRDLFKFQSMRLDDKIFYENGVHKDKKWKWKRNRLLFDKWCNGQTGYPFIDSAMIELKKTGFQSFRLRQNCASFLVNDLKIDWRWGAEWFESLLIDYDCALNYCNWVNIAFATFSHKDTMHFNVMGKANKYDRNGEFVKLWMPKLKNVQKQFVHRPHKMSFQQQQFNQMMFGKTNHPIKPLGIGSKRNDKKYTKNRTKSRARGAFGYS